MDPAKRICLKNLPDNCTKREIAEFIRNRTGAQPHSIDLGLDAEGHVRHYAHFSCEGAKNVLEVLTGGAMLRDTLVQALPAKQHYSFRYAEARRKREREEEETATQLATFWEEQRERFLRRSGGECKAAKAPKSFYATKRKYANIASEIADAARKAHAAAWGTAEAGPYSAGAAAGGSGSGSSGPYHHQQQAHGEHAEGTAPAPHDHEQHAEKQPPSTHHHAKGGPHSNHSNSKKKNYPGKKMKKEVPAAEPAAPPPPPPPPQPTKEERKVAGLQAKLKALQSKILKKK